MLDTSIIKMGSTTQNVRINSPCTGILQRSHPKSIFIRFDKGSRMESWIFEQDGKPATLRETDYRGSWNVIKTVEVLQVMVYGNEKFLVEVVDVKCLIEEPCAK